MLDAPGRLAPAWASCAVALASIVVWARVLASAYLVVGAVACAIGLALAVAARRASRGRPPDPAGRGGGAVLAALVVAALAGTAGVHTEHRLGRLATDWPELAAEYRAARTAALEERMAATVRRGERTAELAAERASSGGADVFEEIDALRRRSEVSAIAVFSVAGDLTAWAGVHRGDLPAAVRTDGRPVQYAERPLFSYLYFSTPLDGRAGHAVAVLALESSLPVRGGVETLADRFAERTGVRPTFAAGPSDDASWRLDREGGTVVHARLEGVTQAAWRARTVAGGRRAALALAAVAFALLVLARARGRGGGAAPLALGALLLAVAPLGAVSGLDPLFSPALFLFPLPWDVPLGAVLAAGAPLAAIVAVRRRRLLAGVAPRWAYAAAAVLAGIGFVGGIQAMFAGAGSPMLQGGAALWFGFQVATVLVLATVAALVMPIETSRPGRVRPLPLFGGLALASILAGVVLLRLRLGEPAAPWFAATWGVPVAAVAYGLARRGGRRGSFLRWLVAGALAATAVLPHVWVANVDARLAATERELRTLGSRPDPFADYLLRQFAVEAARRARADEDAVGLLYRSWVASGLARAGLPVRVALWDATFERDVELPLSGADRARSRAEGGSPWMRGLLGRARDRGGPVVEPIPDQPEAGQAMAAPLEDGRLVSVVVPPRRTLDRTPVIAPFLGAAQPNPDARLTLVPAMPGDTLRPGVIQWRPTERGWRSELIVPYPEGAHHVHFELRMPSSGVLVARGLLLLALDLGVLALIWLVGSIAGGETPRPPGGWTAWVRSFRARVTLALFGFFLLPVALFGAIAYRALAGEVTRTGRTVAEHAVTQAVDAFAASGGDLAALADYTGREVLYYYRGELARASSPEAIDLGLYGSWMPPPVFRTLASGEEPTAVETRELGGQPYLVAYRSLPAAGALAVPVSLRASEAATRQTELAHLILFAVLMGAVLSTTLSVAVGRALARPLGRLRRAAAEVGAGRLEAQLPEHRGDEFGELFASFNRMVNRLRRARSQELRTARVLAWGEMARQVAHEIKNPLTPIKLSVQHLRRAYRDRREDFAEILEANVEQILAEIEQLTEIARAFSRYGLPPEAAGPLERVDVAAIVREALTLYRAAESPVAYRLHVEPGVPAAHARSGELREVLLNLLENAREAVDGEGTVRVGVRSEGEWVEVAVSDDGVGIPADSLPRIFEPQFSTRSSGTGLGLAIVRRLVEGWGGDVTAESEPGRGTTVRVRLRPVERRVAAGATGAAEEVDAGGAAAGGDDGAPRSGVEEGRDARGGEPEA